MTPALLDALLAHADPDAAIVDVDIYLNWVIVKTNDYAMSTLLGGMPGLVDPQGMCTYMGDIIGQNGKEIARNFLLSNETLKRAVGMACLKSLLPPIDNCEEGNAIDLRKEFARTHNTCFIGHFFEAEQWRAQGFPVSIVELFPKEGDIHWNDSHAILAEAGQVLMTGLTLINDTFDEVIARTPHAQYRVIMGPTVPLCSALFDFGIQQIGGTVIHDPYATMRYCRMGGGSIAHAPNGALRKINLIKGNTYD